MNSRIPLSSLQATVLETLSNGPPPMDFHRGIIETPRNHITPAFTIEMKIGGYNI